ncbi:DNA repair protein rad16 [Exophiala xenobiotica]|uniref:DNA repair protein rad16 n=1 Tax=Vermiconidia calcicola TaxID=1690605 RepID=A0AAV9QGT8_9PEZI|nr:DNA repair protein rad16 [Exophiala xenobiotica]KAK5542413.1 DNA repair protein rad16 [Vermiconidia calcicola]KAK5546271.1 DNA repair protein rad16 [Chaetothyriales sp. CCFEE 6169]KAK5195725.1 DNA repair protein rad16 [Exophiala xenobiotica]KAK5210100.1 DNA repair protein rad16 [Exophiala xenobiotica]
MGPRRRPARPSASKRTSSSKIATPEPSLPKTKQSTRRSTRAPKAAEIPDSDGVEEILSSDPIPKGTFRGVFLPSNGSDSIKNRGTRPASTAPSSIADSMDSANYETPDTSTVPTPNATDYAIPKTKVTATARARELQSSEFALKPRSSRKRTAGLALEDPEEDADESLARLLQAQEYDMANDGDDSDAQPLSKRRRTQTEVLDTDDSDDDVPLALRPRTKLAMPTLNDSGVRAGASLDDSELSSVLSFAETDLSEFDTFSFAGAQSEASEDVDDDNDAGPSGLASSRRRRIPSPFLWDPQKRRAKRERQRLEKSHPEIKTMWDELQTIEPIQPVPAQQPESINRKLKRFQLEGLDWMVKQEKSTWKGGLLGDEMGMGKTIQAVSLIMSDWPAKEPSLVVVPPVALMQWQAEINDYTSGKLKVLIYHISANPKCKLLTVKDLKKYDVIMVSYSSLESMYRKQNKGWSRNDGLVKEDSILHAIKFHRLILDEAHSIKSRTTGVAKACFALKSNYKWCLSGTPVQNRIGEFFSLLRFLEVMPFACYFCKSCKCRQLHWSQDKQKMCTGCKHSGFNHVSVFNQEILNPITQAEDPDLRKKGLEKLRFITDRIMLRRMKRDHTSSMELPPKDVIVHNEFFGEIERDFSQSIMSNSTRKFDTYVNQGVMLNNYANIFGLIMQMRQVANHPDLILRRNGEGGQNILVCCICDEPAEEAIRSKCHHEFCRQCAKSYVQSFAGGGGDADCPRCHIPLQIDWEQPEIEQDEENVKKSSIINRIKMEDWTSSTKIEMLVYDLYKLRSKKQTHKSIVFSQFTSMLQLVQWRLQKSGFSTVLLDGSMSPAQRQKSIDHFMNNVDCEVFLVSLKAGGVALNLTEASRVYIIDPWWNPAAEWQSADRCHRIGQRRPCVITRLVIEDSVESRMVLLQEKKANMINGTVNNDQVALDKLTPEDMQFLFRGS